jgi:hypothetical protein
MSATEQTRSEQHADYEAGEKAGRAAYERYGPSVVRTHADEPELDAWQHGYHDGAVAAEALDVVETLLLDSAWASQYDNPRRKSA